MMRGGAEECRYRLRRAAPQGKPLCGRLWRPCPAAGFAVDGSPEGEVKRMANPPTARPPGREDSPNGKRYGRRHEKTGRIIEAYGFDLAPITARHAEFRRVAEEGRAERAAMGRLRRRATIARKAIIQILETAREYGFEGEEGSRWPARARP
jgi:hypothetical protein